MKFKNSSTEKSYFSFPHTTTIEKSSNALEVRRDSPSWFAHWSAYNDKYNKSQSGSPIQCAVIGCTQSEVKNGVLVTIDKSCSGEFSEKHYETKSIVPMCDWHAEFNETYLMTRDNAFFVFSDAAPVKNILADQATLRWGIPKLEPIEGKCQTCASFFKISESQPTFKIHYGCCSSENSPFDGKIVHTSSGCPMFKNKTNTIQSHT